MKKAKGHSNQKASTFGSFVFGILIGIFASCLTVFTFSTADITLKIPSMRNSKAKPAVVKPKQANKVVQQAKVEEPRFDFYTELAKNDNTPVLDLKSKPKTINGYVVQAGSFKKISDAQALKAKLTLNGYDAKIESIQQRDGELWQHVILGTYKTEQHAKSLQQQLKSLDVDSVLVLKYAE